MSDVVLVHGAWHGAWCWARVVEELNTLGVSSNAVELPLTGLTDDAATARTSIESAIDSAGPGVVVVGHSYGGIVVSQAAAGIDGVGCLVYLAAFMTDEGEDELSIMAAHDSSVLRSVVAVDGGAGIDPAKAHALFYGDSDAATVAEIVPLLRPMRGGGALTGAPAW
jgi:pimeloyl-ACP methyl ester carboxylesterase